MSKNNINYSFNLKPLSSIPVLAKAVTQVLTPIQERLKKAFEDSDNKQTPSHPSCHCKIGSKEMTFNEVLKKRVTSNSTILERSYDFVHWELNTPGYEKITYFQFDKRSNCPMDVIKIISNQYDQNKFTPCTVQSVLNSLIMLRMLFRHIKMQMHTSVFHLDMMWVAAVGVSNQLDPFLVATFEPFGAIWLMEESNSKGSAKKIRNVLYAYIRDPIKWASKGTHTKLHKDLMKHPMYSHWWLPLTDCLARSIPIDLNDQLIDWESFKRCVMLRSQTISKISAMIDLGEDIRKGVAATKGKLF